MKSRSITFVYGILSFLFLLCCVPVSLFAATMSMQDYCITPPFISQQVPPQVMFTLGKDHKFFYPAYNDASDLDSDGALDTAYKHAFTYVGYFDPELCYTYETSGSSAQTFVPFAKTTDKYCTGSNAGKWSGNFLNWATMSRADLVKLVLYGGWRQSDSTGATWVTIAGENIPQDGHSWGKEYLGADANKLFPTGVANHRALLCVTTSASASTNSIKNNNPARAMLKVIPNVDDANLAASVTATGGLRPWHWINVEMGSNLTICSSTQIDLDGNGSADNIPAAYSSMSEHSVEVKACDTSFSDTQWSKEYCKTYPNGNSRPIGLMQVYGEGDTTKGVCTKDLSTSCSSDSTCSSASKGECIAYAKMFFGLMTGSYQNPKEGGILKKKVWNINNETNDNNGYISCNNSDSKGCITKAVEALSCPTTYPLNKHWGNPVGEILYEDMRYWAGRGAPTSAYTAGLSTCSGSSTAECYMGWDNPRSLFPSCSIPFNLVFSDIYNSFDDNSLPGTAYGTFTGDLTDLNVKTLANKISANENKTSAIIGESVAASNPSGICDAKDIVNSDPISHGFGDIRGICPAEGDLQGTYYPAAVALYGKTLLETKMPGTGAHNVITYAVAFASNVPEIKLNANGKDVTIIPFSKAIADNTATGWSCNSTNFTFNLDTSSASGRGLVITPKAGQSGKCPTMAITSFYMLDHKYTGGKLTYAKFLVASDTLNGTSDYDMDGLIEYEACAGPSATGCNDASVGSDQVKITLTPKSSAAGTDIAHGFVVTGTGSSTDGSYLPVKKFYQTTCAAGTGGNCPKQITGTTVNLYNLWATKSYTFTASSTNAALLKDPMWYTAKYGGFEDFDKDNLPYTDSTCGTATPNAKCTEWDSNGDGQPDNYFLVSNPAQLRTKLIAAFDAILARTASGTAASILSNSQGSGANILQAVFFPLKNYANNTNVAWTGELQNLWYYVDPFIGGSTIREDSDYTTTEPLPSPNPDHTMNLRNDNVIQFFFDAGINQTKIRRIKNDGSTEEVFTDDPQKGVMSLWSAGKLLWNRTASSRTIYTSTDAASLLSFEDANASTLESYLQSSGTGAAKTADATRIINYVRGVDVCRDATSPCTSKSRNRNVTLQHRDNSLSSNVWKLGDIVSSTPRIQGNQGMQAYNLKRPLGYDDTTYKDFISSAAYLNRGMVYLGANDGMLHAFKLGKLNIAAAGDNLATLTGQGLGEEQWAYIPRNTLPYLKYMMDPAYKDNHIFFVDGTIGLFDVSTNSASSDYWNEARTSSSWKTFLIGSMGIGGASKINTSTCTDGTAAGTCVKTPIMDPDAPTKGLGYSSYFALDITNQDFNADSSNNLRAQPTLKWEFSHPDLGFTTSGPALVRINAKTVVGSSVNHATNKNGRWLAVFASGPTGPIDKTTRQFKGKSDQNLKLFVVDVEKGPTTGNWWVIDTGIAEAFAGNIGTAVIDTERAGTAEGYYQDDALYIGYTKKSAGGTWTEGGVLRVVIPHENNPDTGFDPSTQWIVSKVIEGTGSDNIGPVTTAVAKLQGASLYLFFGSGRYFYPQDDMSSQRRLYMVKDNCYKTQVTHADTTKKTSYDIEDKAADSCHATTSTLSLASLTNRTAGTDDTSVTNGWYINLGTAERVNTDTVATVNGAIYYTTFVPNADICKFGGSAYFWGVKYDTGYQLPASSKQGKALIQVSTGSFEEVDIARVLTDSEGRKSSAPLTGKPAADAPPIITKAGLNPTKKVLHIQERQK